MENIYFLTVKDTYLNTNDLNDFTKFLRNQISCKQHHFFTFDKNKNALQIFNEFCKWLGIEYVYEIDKSSSSESLIGLKKKKYCAILYLFQFIKHKIYDLNERLSIDISEFLISEYLKQYHAIEKEKYDYINFISSIELSEITNPIGLVQEIFQKFSKFDTKIKSLPVYSFVEQNNNSGSRSSGSSGSSRFSCQIEAINIGNNNSNILLEAHGPSKKHAKTQAAFEMIKYIKSITNNFF